MRRLGSSAVVDEPPGFQAMPFFVVEGLSQVVPIKLQEATSIKDPEFIVRIRRILLLESLHLCACLQFRGQAPRKRPMTCASAAHVVELFQGL